METTLEVFIQLLPSILIVFLLIFLIILYLKFSKYFQLKTKYYSEKLKEIEKRNKE